MDWAVDGGGTPSAATGPTTDHDPGTAPGKYLYIESSQPCAGGLVAHLVSPPLELQNTTNPQVQFWVHMDGQSMGALHVDLFDGNGWQLDIVAPITDDLDQWQQTPLIDLSPWIGSTVHLRLRGVTGWSYESDMAVDDFAFLDFGTNDVGVIAIIDPVSGMCGLSADEVVVEVMNFGMAAQSNVPVQVQVGGAVTAPVTQSTTYYTQREYGPADHIGPVDNTFGTGGNHAPAFGRGLVFDVSSAVLIDSVQVYPNGPGDVVVRLLDPNANLLAAATVAVNTAGNKTLIPERDRRQHQRRRGRRYGSDGHRGLGLRLSARRSQGQRARPLGSPGPGLDAAGARVAAAPAAPILT